MSSSFNLDDPATRAALNLTDIRHRTPAWFDARAKALTGTDVAAIMGRAKWATPLDTWYRLTLQQPERKKETSFMRWGTLTESINAREFEQITGCSIHVNDRLAVHPALPFVGSPDAFIEDPFLDGIGVLEMKAPSAFTADEWSEGDAPVFYADQLKMYLLATGCSWGVLSAIVPPARADDDLIRTSRVEWADGEKDAMVAVLMDWHRVHVIGEKQPDAIAGDMDRLRALHADDELRTVMLDSDECMLLEDIDEAKIDEKAATARHEDAKAQLMQRMGNAIYATTPSGHSVSWKTNAAGNRTFRLMQQLPAAAPEPS